MLLTSTQHALLKSPFSSQSPSPSSFSPRFRMSSAGPALPPLPDNRIVVVTLFAFFLDLNLLFNYDSFIYAASRGVDDLAVSIAHLHICLSVQVGCGSVTLDFLAAVATYPKPDDKTRSTSSKVQGGGNAGNALTCASRLGLQPRLISKVADDSQGKGILEELEADGVDSSFIVVSEGGNSPFTYIIVDDETKTRTCIHTPGYPPMIPDDLTESKLLAAVDGARLVYFDGRLHDTALVIAQEATRRGIPILIDAERRREGLDDLLSLSSYAICSAKFPQSWTGAPSVTSALVSMLIKLPNLKFVVVTLGEDGCIMLERSNEKGLTEPVDVDELLVALKYKNDTKTTLPTCVASSEVKLHAKGIGTVGGRLLLGTAENIPPSELVDTTGAGDSFIGAILYALCTNMPPEKMLPFASQVAGINCRALGARTGLPRRSDPRLTSFLV